MRIYLLGDIKVSGGGGSVRVCVCVCVVVAVMVCVCVCVCSCWWCVCVCACVRLCASIIGDSVRLCVCVVVAAIAWWWRPLHALLFVCVYACADAQSAHKKYTHQHRNHYTPAACTHQ